MSRPRVLFVGPTRYELPLSPGLERKWSAIELELEVRILARQVTQCYKVDPRFELVARVVLRLSARSRASRGA